MRMDLFGILAGALACLAAHAQPVYVEKNGLVVFEAESTTVAGGWRIEKSLPDFMGTGYLNYPGPGNTTNTLGQGKDPLAYKFKINAPGKYWLRIRMYHCTPRGDLDNDTWVQVDNLGWYKYYQLGGKSTLTNCKTNPPWSYLVGYSPTGTDASNTVTTTFDLQAGVHSFRFSARSYNIHIDRVHFCHDQGTGDHANSTGICYDAAQPVSAKEAASTIKAKAVFLKSGLGMGSRGKALQVDLQGAYTIELLSLSGRTLARFTGERPQAFSLEPYDLPAGLLLARIGTAEGFETVAAGLAR